MVHLNFHLKQCIIYQHLDKETVAALEEKIVQRRSPTPISYHYEQKGDYVVFTQAVEIPSPVMVQLKKIVYPHSTLPFQVTFLG